MIARAIGSAAIDLLYPPRCVACAVATDADRAFCPPCATTLLAPRRACRRCGRPDAAPSCPACAVAPPPFLSLHAPHLYGGQLALAIQRLKRRSELARPLARLFAPHLPRLRGTVELALPVPLHRARLRRRGYNQAALLLRPVARQLRIPLAPRALQRIVDTRRQSGLGRAERRRNVARAFRAKARAVAGRRVLLLDDVVTSGATAAACSRALLAAGAHEVHVLALARAEG